MTLDVLAEGFGHHHHVLSSFRLYLLSFVIDSE